MSSSPSWKSSTLAQAFLGSLVCYWAILLIVSVGLIVKHLDVEVAKLIVGWASALEASLASAYLTARKTNGEPPTPPPIPPAPPAAKPVVSLI